MCLKAIKSVHSHTKAFSRSVVNTDIELESMAQVILSGTSEQQPNGVFEVTVDTAEVISKKLNLIDAIETKIELLDDYRLSKNRLR